MRWFVLTAALVAVMPPGAAADKAHEGVRRALQVETWARVIVNFTAVPAGVDISSRSAVIAVRSGSVLDAVSEDEFRLIYRWEAVNAMAGMITAAGLAKLESSADVATIELDAGGGGGLVQSVPLINADIVRDTLDFGGEGVVVAVLDTGVDTDHPDLVESIIDEHCFCMVLGGAGCCPGGVAEASGPGSAEDDNQHGTNIAGIIVSAGTIAPRGIAPDAELIAVKVLDKDNLFAFSSQVISGLDWLIINHPGVDVVNMSLGTAQLFFRVCDTTSDVGLFDAVKTLTGMGAVVVASTQNEGAKNRIAAPACFSETISVSAVYDSNVGPALIFDCLDEGTVADLVPCFANSNIVTDLLAPGSKTTSTGLDGRLSTQSGTSQAAAHVSASAAVLKGIDPDFTPEEILEILRTTGRSVEDPANRLFFPRIDLLAAVNSIMPPGAEDCGDTVDNDGDGKIDCADEECDGVEAFPALFCEFRTESTCTDGFDNDADGRIDGDDGDCKGPSDLDPIEAFTEAAAAVCSIAGPRTTGHGRSALTGTLPLLLMLVFVFVGRKARIAKIFCKEKHI